MRKSKIIIVVALILVGLILLLKPTTLSSSQDVIIPEVKVEPVKATSTPIKKVSRITKPIVRPPEYVEIVQVKAEQYNVSVELMTAIIDCENRDWIPTQQSNHTYKKDRPDIGVSAGEREKSFGLVQIHLPAHPSISYEQATNPTFSIEFLASELSAGRGRQWSCYPTALQKLAQSNPKGQYTE